MAARLAGATIPGAVLGLDDGAAAGATRRRPLRAERQVGGLAAARARTRACTGALSGLGDGTVCVAARRRPLGAKRKVGGLSELLGIVVSVTVGAVVVSVTVVSSSSSPQPASATAISKTKPLRRTHRRRTRMLRPYSGAVIGVKLQSVARRESRPGPLAAP